MSLTNHGDPVTVAHRKTGGPETMFGKRTVVAAAATLILSLAAASPAAAASPCSQPTGRPWCDTSLSPDKRAGLLLKALTQDEKISLLAGDGSNDGHTGAT